MSTFNSGLFETLKQVVQTGEYSFQRPSQLEEYQRFIAQYPLERLTELSLDDYCLGLGSRKENFCWWLEVGLRKSLGRYFPGNATAHVLYKNRKGELAIVKSLEDLSAEEALAYTLRIQATIAGANREEDLRWVDDDEEIYRRAGVEPRRTVADGRKLRLLMAYNPDFCIPISSTDHLGHFLHVLGTPESEIPKKKQPIARMLLLREYYLEAQRRIDSRLTPYGFMMALYNDELGIQPENASIDEKKSSVDTGLVGIREGEGSGVEKGEALREFHPLNQILYGPPGTGKTYATVEMAVRIADPERSREILNGPENARRPLFKERFDEMVADRQVMMVTFHQSFAYEDFLEGIRANTSEEGGLQYEVEDGVFKQICEAASSQVTSKVKSKITLEGRRFWKMSLGNTQSGDDSIYQECIENGYLLLGYGGSVDFRGCQSRQDIADSMGDGVLPEAYSVTAVHTFQQKMKKGDLVVVSDGNRKFRAIAEIKGDYEFLGDDDRGDYQQMRPVEWLQQYAPSRPVEQLFEKNLSQRTLYELRSGTINRDKLKRLLAPPVATQSVRKPHVLIIDEINRGNISRIFGESITLLEESKRKGRADAQQVVLPYSKTSFSVPDNLYVIGTMNTADKSLAQLDIALRRRFSFVEKPPEPGLLSGTEVYGVDLGEMLQVMNERIEALLDSEHRLGHSYFLPLTVEMTSEEREERLREIFSQNVVPLLQEYFFEDWSRVGWVLNDHRKAVENRFVRSGGRRSLEALFGRELLAEEQLHERRFSLNPSAFTNPLAYLGIVEVAS